MFFFDGFRFSLSSITSHRLRTALTLLGMGVGVAAVIVLTGLGEGARRYVTQEFMSLGSNLLIVLPGKVETSGAAPYGGTTHDLTIDDYVTMRTRLPLVRSGAPVCVATEKVRYGSRARSVPILGSTSELLPIRRLEIQSGRFLSPGDPDQGGTEVVLGTKVAHEVFGPESPLGKIVRIGTWRFRVVGVLAPKGRSLGFDMDDVVIVPVRTAMQIFNRTTLFRVLLEVRSAGEMAAAKKDVLKLMKDRHRVEDITVITQDAVLTAFSSILNALTLALVAIASISLGVAGIGIMNVMLISVTERRTEIGLLKALGAFRRQIMGVFLLDAVMLSLLGGLLGLGAGIAGIRIFMAFYPGFPANPPIWGVLSALLLSIGVGVIFGAWPAVRASRLEPVTALARR
ncbi:MAG TPA: ABC transporter permease [Thermoanaerobaculia bacterium]|nr:ABC transporter permease [Thermoanaerobaculia bacterium]HUM30374.1 ABC transporter permease [Thermoanaerobaculia bacterium]HXK68615.1 ABC transporter permease [Thermoanaerobaculia bacterium]